MSYSAPNRLLMPMRHSIDTISDSWLPIRGWTGSTVWPSANLAIYVPIGITQSILVKKLWFGSSSTSTGNVDMALYDAAGVAVVAATNAAKIASNDEQVFDVTDTPIGPGLYWIALSSDSATDTFNMIQTSAADCAQMGVLTEAAAYPLPSTATWARDYTYGRWPTMGILIESTVA